MLLGGLFSSWKNKSENSSKVYQRKYQESAFKNEQKETAETSQAKKNEPHVTEYKTVSDTTECLGKIIYAESNKIFKVKLTDESEPYVHLENLSWTVIAGDKVRVQFSRDLKIVNLLPQKKEHKVCRVTALSEKHAVFDDNKILFYKTIKSDMSLKMFNTYKVEVIESEQKSDISTFDYRITSLLKQEEESNKVVEKRVKFEHSAFKIYLSQEEKREVGTKHITICNISERSIKLNSMKIVPFHAANADLISFDKEDVRIDFIMKPKVGKFKAFFQINPSKTGKFYFHLITNFGNFSDKHEFSIDIQKAFVIPGEKPYKTTRFVDIKISEHAVPNDLREIDFSKYRRAQEKLETLYPSLKEDLSPANYRERMKVEIYLEEVALEKSFANYHINRGSFETKDEYLKLTVENVAEKRPSIIIGDKIIATEWTDKKVLKEKTINEGYIHKIGNNFILVKFDSLFHEQHAEKEYSVDFVFSRTVFRREHHALETFLQNGEFAYNFLFPNDKISMRQIQLNASINSDGSLYIDDKKHNWYNNLLNDCQKKAVVNVLRGEKRPLPYIFFGCPGSGKTKTVVETILQIHKHISSSKILVAAPSNSAANLILEMLLSSNAFDEEHPKLLRIIGNNQIEKELIPDNLMKYCGTVSIASESGGKNVSSPTRNQQGVLQNCSKSVIMKHKIVIGTLNIFACLMQMSLDSYFSHVMIDEAGQAVESEVIIPLTLVSKKSQCVFAGDPKQLGPIAISRYAKDYHFNMSLLERLISTHPYYSQTHGPNGDDYDQNFVTKLTTNYRSHPSVLKLYNDIFYDGELQNAVNDTDSLEALFLSSLDDLIWPSMKNNCGVIFVNVANGKNKKTPESSSWYNEQEINAVLAILNKCRTKSIPFKKIGVMAPYALQVNKLKNQILTLNDADLKVGTVEEFQGQERLVMIVSTVRTEECHLKNDVRFNLGFLQCPKRINVAISRARALMVIFGKETLLEKDSHWKRIIEYAKANNTFVSENY